MASNEKPKEPWERRICKHRFFNRKAWVTRTVNFQIVGKQPWETKVIKYTESYERKPIIACSECGQVKRG